MSLSLDIDYFYAVMQIRKEYMFYIHVQVRHFFCTRSLFLVKFNYSDKYSDFTSTVMVQIKGDFGFRES